MKTAIQSSDETNGVMYQQQMEYLKTNKQTSWSKKSNIDTTAANCINETRLSYRQFLCAMPYCFNLQIKNKLYE